MHGHFETIRERPALTFERHIAHPVEATWEAITQPSELAHWFPCEVEVDLRLGAKMRFHFPEVTRPETAADMLGEVTEFDPPRRFAFLWGEDHLSFVLDPSDDGTGCTLQFTVELGAREKAARDAAGWHVCLDALERRLDGGEDSAVTRASSQWRELYADYERRGMPVGAPIPGDGQR
jgi:uncharacterized protein YndB with AHSA1/START domain